MVSAGSSVRGRRRFECQPSPGKLEIAFRMGMRKRTATAYVQNDPSRHDAWSAIIACHPGFATGDDMAKDWMRMSHREEEREIDFVTAAKSTIDRGRRDDSEASDRPAAMFRLVILVPPSGLAGPAS